MKAKRRGADVLGQNIQEIMRRWENRASQEVSAAFGQSSLVLRDSLPEFLHSLKRLISHDERTEDQLGLDAVEMLKNSKEHGRGRAEISTYLMSQVIKEYHILREVVFQVLEENKALSVVDREILTSALEEAVNVSATEFAAAMREIQEHFMLSIAHDLKNPMTSALAGAELIRRSPESRSIVPIAEQMVESMRRMTDMIEKIHDRSRIESGGKLALPLSECDLDAIVQDVVADMRLVFGDCFSVVSVGPVLGLWNEEYLRRAIENLVNNAFKYHRSETPITVNLRQSEQNAVIELHNFGDPIPASDQAALFSTLRWKKKGRTLKGWGLGLALVKGVVDAFGGSIRVESTEEKGTTFTVVLPKRAEASEPTRMAV